MFLVRSSTSEKTSGKKRKRGGGGESVFLGLGDRSFFSEEGAEEVILSPEEEEGTGLVVAPAIVSVGRKFLRIRKPREWELSGSMGCQGSRASLRLGFFAGTEGAPLKKQQKLRR